MVDLDSATLFAVMDYFVDRVADRVVERMGREHPRYACARSNPLNSKRAFLDAARREDFPTFKRGREVVALWSDVERYIEDRRCPTRARMSVRAAEDDDLGLLERAGVRLRDQRPANDRRSR